MNLYEKFLNEWREDAVMGDDLFDEARKIPILHSKWLDKYLKIQLLKKEKEYEYNRLYLRKYSYYMGREETCPDDKLSRQKFQSI